MSRLRKGVRERRAPGRRTRAALAITVVLHVLAGCGAGQLAATAGHVSTAGGANGQVGEIHVEHAQITFAGPVDGDAVYRPGAARPLQVTIINSGDAGDRLLAVTSPVVSAVQITGDTRVPGGHALTEGYDDPLAAVTLPKATAIDITLTGLATPLRAGLTCSITFRFGRAGELTLELPIEYPGRSRLRGPARSHPKWTTCSRPRPRSPSCHPDEASRTGRRPRRHGR